MKLYLAIAVLVLAFVAYSEAQEQTFEENMSKIGEIGKNLAEKVKTTFQEIHTSPFAESTRNWFQDQFNKLKEKLGELSQ